MRHPIVQALFGDEKLPAPEADVLKKILNDNLLLLRVQEWMAVCFSEYVIANRFNGLEKAAFIKRLGGGPTVGPEIRWNVVEGTELPYIRGVFLVGGVLKEDVRFTGPPETARAFVWRGQNIPNHLILQYAELYRPGSNLPAEYWAAVHHKPAGENKTRVEQERERQTAVALERELNGE